MNYRIRSIALLAGALASVLLLAACGGDSGGASAAELGERTGDLPPAAADLPPDETGFFTEPTWVDGETVTLHASFDIAQPDVDTPLYTIGAVDEDNPQDSETSGGIGPHDHVGVTIAEDDLRNCVVTSVSPGPEATEDNVHTRQSASSTLAYEVDLGEGFVALTSVEVIEAAEEAGLVQFGHPDPAIEAACFLG